MRPGELDRRITLRTATQSQGATGQNLDTFADLAANVPAKKFDVSGRESNRDGQEVAVGTTIWTVRWRSDFNTTGQVVEGSDTYDVTFVGEVSRTGRRNYMEIHSTRRTDG